MTEHPITLNPDECRLVLALEPGNTMVLTRAFRVPDAGVYRHWNHAKLRRGRILVLRDDGDHYWADSPLGYPGDVLIVDIIFDERTVAVGFGQIHLAVVSVAPRLDGETWVVDAKVKKEK